MLEIHIQIGCVSMEGIFNNFILFIKIQFTLKKMDQETLGWFEYAGDEHLSKIEKSNSIKGTKIQMVEWENNKKIC